MKKEIFRVGDKVFDIIFGWGKVTEVYYLQDRDYPVSVQFENSIIKYTYDGKWNTADSYSRLSFTEYGFDDRFSQERPVNYEDCIEKWGKFWNDNPKYFTIGILKGCEQDGHKPFQSVSLDFQNFEPLTDEQIKILELE